MAARPDGSGTWSFRATGKSSLKTQAPTSKTQPAKGGRADAKSADTKPGQTPLDMQGQVELFAQAMKLFHQRQWTEAARLFETAAGGPAPDIAHTARTHLKMCARRQEQDALKPDTAEDHYTAGVVLLNRGDYAAAAGHLREALAADGDADHIHSAYALCAGMQGDLGLCAEHLQRAIALRPATRNAVRNDPDWAVLARQSPIRELLQPERGPSA